MEDIYVKPDLTFDFSSLMSNKESSSSESLNDMLSNTQSDADEGANAETNADEANADEASNAEANAEASNAEANADEASNAEANADEGANADEASNAEASNAEAYADEGASNAEAYADEGANADECAPVEIIVDKDIVLGSEYPTLTNIDPPNEMEKKDYLILTKAIIETSNTSNYDVVTLPNTSTSKWVSVMHYLKRNVEWKSYKYIWMIDENVSVTNEQINVFFNTIKSVNSGIFQPSILRSNDSSVYTHKMLLHDPKVTGVVKVVFVENKLPCFSTDIVEKTLLPFLLQNKDFLTSGWGIDLWWSKQCEGNLHLVHGIQVINTPPPVVINKKQGSTELNYFIRKYKLKLSILC